MKLVKKKKNAVKEILMVGLDYTYFLYKQLALGQQLAKQVLGLNLFSLSNNKNYRLKKRGVFPL